MTQVPGTDDGGTGPGGHAKTRRQHRRSAVATVAVATLVAGAAVVALAVHREAGDSSRATSADATAAPDQAGTPASASELRASLQPVRVEVPALHIDAPLDRLGLQEDRTVEVPSIPDHAGWFTPGTVPGQVGSAVILGHVDSVDGPAVFADLDTAEAGDRIAVTMADGHRERFEVRTVRTYLNDDFPAQKVYTSHGRPLLSLITCGGDYDASGGGYQANVVVYARRV